MNITKKNKEQTNENSQETIIELSQKKKKEKEKERKYGRNRY